MMSRGLIVRLNETADVEREARRQSASSARERRLARWAVSSTLWQNAAICCRSAAPLKLLLYERRRW